ncbi:hypothetical protein CAPI_08940 [Corynebacterium capitovis DSM 44611]|nr:hypothetical protein CAPI_08940 [Corynebacterium capitovis DSM 44611]
MTTKSQNSKEGVSWILSVILAANLSVGLALFSGDHVPNWAYGAKFLAILFAVRALNQLAYDRGDTKKISCLP